MRARRRQARSESRGLRDARVDDVYVQLIGPDVAVFFAAWEKDVLPFPHVTPSCWSSRTDVSRRAMARRRFPH